MRPALLLVLLATGCIEALSPQDVTNLKNAAAIDARLYERERVAADGGPSFSAAMARAAYCATTKVLADADASVAPAAGIVCEVKP